MVKKDWGNWIFWSTAWVFWAWMFIDAIRPLGTWRGSVALVAAYLLVESGRKCRRLERGEKVQ